MNAFASSEMFFQYLSWLRTGVHTGKCVRMLSVRASCLDVQLELAGAALLDQLLRVARPERNVPAKEGIGDDSERIGCVRLHQRVPAAAAIITDPTDHRSTGFP